MPRLRNYDKARRARAARELTHHLGYEIGQAKPLGRTNHRNGTSRKRIATDDDLLDVEIPRDREGTFDPVLIAKGERRCTGFDEKIIAMYARGMSVREIQDFLLEMYGIEVSPNFISTVTDAVIDEVREWQQRPLEPMYPVAFFDALRVKIRDEGVVHNKAIYLALGVRRDGTRDVLRRSILRVASRSYARLYPADPSCTRATAVGALDA